MPNFECLYLLSNHDLHIIEVKRLDLPDQASTSEKFHWLKINGRNFEITPLTFISMDSTETIEERYFEEGYLKFNEQNGTFIEKYNSAQHSLQRCDADHKNKNIHQAIAAFLHA
jgi:hypothetical protein